MDKSQADNSVKNPQNVPINNPKPDPHSINVHTKFGENLLIFTRYHPEMKIRTDGHSYERYVMRLFL